ncbi:hypothetical protein GDO86_019014 [Hymenochirus boettgeri]|uniref:Uncharacterized protein n=1 Tax=Hymenochirus boettgeri TaxID=247094 RepID=A0A8T2IFD2_9PIPI|nr:hypothetical protein GDO86_019014 [Hymenochirus boettgeri]
MADQHLPVGQGVQIRFIGDLKENGKPRGRRSKQDSYGVAVRVQGIDGQPFVVLNSGDKTKSSYGVQIKTQESYGNASPTSPTEYHSYTSKFSRTNRSFSSESELPENPYDSKSFKPNSSLYSSTSDEEQSAKPQSNIRGRDGLSSLPRPLQGSHRDELRRSQSQGSLTEPEIVESFDYDRHYSERSSTLDTAYSQSSRDSAWSSSSQKIGNGKYATVGRSSTANPQLNSVGVKPLLQKKNGLSIRSPSRQSREEIDTKPLSSVDSLITKFDTKGQVRGRTARRSPALKEERKRSQSLDSRKSYQDTVDVSSIILQQQNEVQTRAEPTNTGNSSFTGQSNERENINRSRLTKEWLDQSAEKPVMVKPGEFQQRMKLEASRPKKLEFQLEESMEECRRLKDLYERKKNELNTMSQE